MIGLEYISNMSGKSYKEIAEKIGVKPPTFQQWLKKDRPIPKKRLDQLSELFGIDKKYFDKELNSVEEIEVRQAWLRKTDYIVDEFDVPAFNNEGGIDGYYTQKVYANEEEFKLLETLKKREMELLKTKALLYEDNEDTVHRNTGMLERFNFILGKDDSKQMGVLDAVLYLLGTEGWGDHPAYEGRITKELSLLFKELGIPHRH